MRKTRIVALVLLATMMLYTVPMAGAVYQDQASVSYQEAVEYLTSLGILEGYEDNTIRPASKISREEMAKMIAVLHNNGVGGLEAYVRNQLFSDVSDTRWSAQYIGYCLQKGIVAGRSAEIFDPLGWVTGVETAKMLLITLDRDAKECGYLGAGWEEHVIRDANAMGLLNNMAAGFDIRSAVTREEAANMMMNALAYSKTPVPMATSTAPPHDEPQTPPVVEVGEMPSDLPEKYRSEDFTVAVNSVAVPVYRAAVNAWNEPVSYASFDFQGRIQITVDVDFSFSTARILPRSAGVECQIQGSQVVFSIDQPQNLTILFDEDFQGKTLHLFAQDLETDAPDPNDPNVLYFGPGYYDYSGQDPILVPSNTTLYLAKGAVVMGRILISDAEHVMVCGRGILLNDYVANDGTYDEVPLVIKRSSDVEIRDITISRDQVIWAAFMANSQNVVVDGVKIVNPRYASSDGFDIANCQNVLYQNMFIRSCDDAISIKGTGVDGYDTAEAPNAGAANEHIMIRDCQIWSDTNNALEIGAETVACYFRDIRFDNIDILYNYDNYEHPDLITYQSAINMCVLNATDISEVYFENIRVEQAKTLISISCQDTYYFGGIIGNQDWEGTVHNIHYRNITSYSDGSNVIRLYGYDGDHLIESVEFENIVVNGARISSFDDPRFQVNRFVKNLRIVQDGSMVDEADGPFGIAGCSAALDFGSEQAKNGWRYLAWNPETGMQEMTWNDAAKRWAGPKYWDQIQKESDAVILLPNSKQLLLEWKSAYEGDITITGNVAKLQPGGDGVSVSIWKNDEMIWPETGVWQGIAADDFVGYAHAVTVSVAVGDVITFRVDQNANEACDQVIWSPSIDLAEAAGPYESYETSAAGDFGTIQGVTGWSYQVLNDIDVWTDMNWNETLQYWTGLRQWDQLCRQGDYVVLLPDSQQMRMGWTAPSDCRVDLSGHVAKYQADSGDGVAVSIWKNECQIWPADGTWQQIAYNDTAGYVYDLSVDVLSGDVITFRVDQNANAAADQVMWKANLRLIGTDIQTPSVTVVSPVSGFSGQQGKNGWTYQALSDGTWVDLVYADDMWKGPLPWDQLHKVGSYIIMLPNSQQLQMTWTADQAGTARITGHVAKYQTDGGDGVQVSIWKNNTKIWPADEGWQQIDFDDSTGYTHDILITVAAGDTISFRVDHNANEACDQVMWNPQLRITAAP